VIKNEIDAPQSNPAAAPCRFVFVAVCGNCVAGACQTNLISSFRHYAVARFYSGEDLHIFAVVGA